MEQNSGKNEQCDDKRQFVFDSPALWELKQALSVLASLVEDYEEDFQEGGPAGMASHKPFGTVSSEKLKAFELLKSVNQKTKLFIKKSQDHRFDAVFAEFNDRLYKLLKQKSINEISHDQYCEIIKKDFNFTVPDENGHNELLFVLSKMTNEEIKRLGGASRAAREVTSIFLGISTRSVDNLKARVRQF